MSTSKVSAVTSPPGSVLGSFIKNGPSIRPSRSSSPRIKKSQESSTSTIDLTASGTASAAGPILKNARKLKNVSDSNLSGTAVRSPESSRVQIVEPPVAKSDRDVLSPINMERRVTTISSDTSGNVEKQTNGYSEVQRTVSTDLQNRSSTTSFSASRSAQTTLRRVRTELQKTRERFFGRFKRKNLIAEETVAAASGSPQPTNRVSPDLICSAGPETNLLHSRDSEMKPVGAKDAEECAMMPVSDMAKDFKTEEPQHDTGVSSPILDNPPSQQINLEHSSAAGLFSEINKRESVADRDAGQIVASQSEEIKRLRQTLSDCHVKIAELEKRCEAQSRDLDNSNNFLSVADKSSDSDVIYALQRLNAELQQTSSYMADFLVGIFEFANLTSDPAKDQHVQNVSQYIGKVLARSLGTTKSPEDIPMLLQIAFQGYIASALCQTASAWAFEPGNHSFMDGIYKRLRKAEAQAVSGRWRSLARVHNVQTWIAYPENLVKGVIAYIADILLAAGCTAPRSDIVSKVATKFEERITSLVDLARRLNKMLNEVITCDFEVFSVPPGDKFEVENMEDADEDQVGVQESPILCATHLGLMKWVPTNTLWERGRKQKVVAVKAKVVLESFLDTDDYGEY